MPKEPLAIPGNANYLPILDTIRLLKGHNQFIFSHELCRGYSIKKNFNLNLKESDLLGSYSLKWFVWRNSSGSDQLSPENNFYDENEGNRS